MAATSRRSSEASFEERTGWCGQAIPIPFPVFCSSLRIEFSTSSRLSKTALFSNRITRIPSSFR